MTYYYIVIILLLSSLFIKGKKGATLGWAAFLLMGLMTIFRGDEVGTDTTAYLMYSAEHRIEEYIVTGMTYMIANDYINNRSIIYVSGFVTYFFSFLCMRKYRIDVRYFSLFFIISGFFAMSMNVARQVAATAIIAYFLPYIYNEKWKKSLLFFVGCILGAGFHLSSLFLVYLYSFRFVHTSTKNNQLLIVILGSAILLNIIPIDTIMQAFMPDVYQGEYLGATQRTLTVSILGYLYRVLILFVYAYMSKFFIYRKDVMLFVFSAIIVNAGIGMNSDVARIFMINTYFIIISSCIVYKSENLKKDSILSFLFIFQVLMGISSTIVFIQNHPNLNPFEFVHF